MSDSKDKRDEKLSEEDEEPDDWYDRQLLPDTRSGQSSPANAAFQGQENLQHRLFWLAFLGLGVGLCSDQVLTFTSRADEDERLLLRQEGLEVLQRGSTSVPSSQFLLITNGHSLFYLVKLLGSRILMTVTNRWKSFGNAGRIRAMIRGRKQRMRWMDPSRAG